MFKWNLSTLSGKSPDDKNNTLFVCFKSQIAFID